MREHHERDQASAATQTLVSQPDLLTGLPMALFLVRPLAACFALRCTSIASSGERLALATRAVACAVLPYQLPAHAIEIRASLSSQSCSVAVPSLKATSQVNLA